MSYAVAILRRGQKELANLAPGAYHDVRDAISGLGQIPKAGLGMQGLVA